MKIRVALALAAFVGIGMASAARAAMINGSFNVTTFGLPSFTGPNLASATSVTFGTPNVATGLAATTSGQPNAFFSGGAAITPGSSVTISPLTVSLTGIGTNTPVNYPNFFQFGPGNRFQFTVTSLTAAGSSVNFLDVNGSGTLTDTLAVFDPTPAAFTSSWLNGGSVNESATFQTYPTPEPASLAVLALGACALLSRRRSA